MEEQWAEVLSKLIKYAGTIFSSLPGFESGRMTVEVDAEQSLEIIISKEKNGELKVSFTLKPKREEEKVTEEVKEKEGFSELGSLF